jgi:hypothetical protein
MEAKKVIEHNIKRRAAFKKMFSTATGQEVLTELEKEFDGDDITGKTVEETYFNLGARHVVRLLKRLRTGE